MNYEAHPDLRRQRPEGKGIKSAMALCRKLLVTRSPKDYLGKEYKELKLFPPFDSKSQWSLNTIKKLNLLFELG